MNIKCFGTLRDGREVSVITLAAGALSARVLTLGAILQDLRLQGTAWPLVLGAPQLGAYEGPMAWFGAVVGPMANRIGGACATIDGTRLRFEANDGANTLHGGASGTSTQLWQVRDLAEDRVTLGLQLPAGLGGFPGNRDITAQYRIIAPATLSLRLTAGTDAPTLMNLAHHPYWNLDGSTDVRAHWLRVAAARYLPTDAACLPLGPPRRLAGAPHDLRVARRLDGLPPLDHNYCLSNSNRRLTPVAELTGASGLRLRLATTAPGLQVYDGAGIDTAPWPGLRGKPYGAHAGLALEPQLWPDAAGRAGYPGVLLSPEENWGQHSTYTFSHGADAAVKEG
jgi:aldose 1-epimerase